MSSLSPDNFHTHLGLAVPLTLLSALGLLVLRSVVPDLVSSQILFLTVAAVVFFVISRIDYRLFFSLHVPIYFISLIFLLSPIIFGSISRGAVRWLQIGPYSLQPSEITKPFFLITFAMLAISSSPRRLLWLFVSGIVPLAIIFYQPDLGSSLVLFIGWIISMFSQLRIKVILPIFLFFTLLLVPMYQFVLHDYQRQRITTFINPYSDPLGSGYHIIQSVIAVGSGQLAGRGLGHGTQSQLMFLPEHHTDFIFASLSEELGFFGSTLVIALFLAIYWHIYQISQSGIGKSESIFCLSVLGLLAFQTFINIGMNLGLSPITGITLPLLSYGGSSILSVFITLGLINSLSQHAHQFRTLEIH